MKGDLDTGMQTKEMERVDVLAVPYFVAQLCEQAGVPVSTVPTKNGAATRVAPAWVKPVWRVAMLGKKDPIAVANEGDERAKFVALLRTIQSMPNLQDEIVALAMLEADDDTLRRAILERSTARLVLVKGAPVNFSRYVRLFNHGCNRDEIGELFALSKEEDRELFGLRPGDPTGLMPAKPLLSWAGLRRVRQQWGESNLYQCISLRAFVDWLRQRRGMSAEGTLLDQIDAAYTLGLLNAT
jgi:hypothetical protein